VYRTAELNAVHYRYAQIGDDQVNRGCFELGQRIAPVLGCQNAVASLPIDLAQSERTAA
jgi:hypothetical protein